MSAQPAEIQVEDVEDFLSRDGICRKAGTTWGGLPALLLKELIDNSQDFPGATFETDGDTYTIADEGPGLSRDDIARLFCIRRPMTSTKRWRRAGRGALGNGLRVACGAAYNLGAEITVQSRDGAFRLCFDSIGELTLEEIGPPRETGTAIVVEFFEYSPPYDAHSLLRDCALSPGAIYDGPANPYTFGMMEFRALARQCGSMTVEAFAKQFGADDITDPEPLSELDEKAIKDLHGRLKHRAKKHFTLPGMGDVRPGHYAQVITPKSIPLGNGAVSPVTVEAWATADRSGSKYTSLDRLWMNRTIAVDRPVASFLAGKLYLSGCGLDSLEINAKRAGYRISLAVTSMHYPMVSDGKAPDLSPFADQIKKAVRQACKKAFEAAEAPPKPEKPAPAPKPEKVEWTSLRDAVFEEIEEAMRHASSDFADVVAFRQLFYAVRARVAVRSDVERELKDSYLRDPLLFDYMAENDVDHWPVIDFDARGSASEPRGGKKSRLSTSAVSSLTSVPPNPEKISAALFIEKEQFGNQLREIQNEFDLLLVEGKGQGTTAEKDLLKWVADAGLPVLIFSDCDIAGFQIAQAIQKGGTDRFPEGIPSAVRVGLDLDDARALDLLPEDCSPSQSQQTWLLGSDLSFDLKTFLCSKRFELNHLSPRQMRTLLREKLTALDIPKAIPAPQRLASMIASQAEEGMAEAVTADLLKEHAKELEPIAKRHREELAPILERHRKELEPIYKRHKEEEEAMRPAIDEAIDAMWDAATGEAYAQSLHDEVRQWLTGDRSRRPWEDAFDAVAATHIEGLIDERETD